MTGDFRYDNRTGRGPGRVLRTLGAVLPGVALVQAQVEPYADAWHAHNTSVIGTPGRRWFVLGDSMSQGIGATAHDAGWVDQLRARLGADADGLRIVNLSATGARVADVLDQQLPALSSLQPGPADLVTVLVGSNDLFGGRAGRALLPGGMAELVDRLPEGAIVATLPQPRAAARLANAHVEAGAAAGRLRMVDMRVAGPPSWRGRLASDWFHPNDAGYAAIADAFEPAVRAALAGT